MANCGVSETNDPNVSVLWEQHGDVVTVWFIPVRKDGKRPALPPMFLNGRGAQDHLKRDDAS